MKKYVIICTVFLFLFSAVSAQVSKDSLIKLMAKETCVEISKKDLSNKTMDELELELGLAMMPIVVKYQDELKSNGYEMEDQQAMEGMGKDVGMQLAKDCPAFLKMFVNNPGALKDALGKTVDKNGKEALPVRHTVSGTLIRIVPGDFSYIQVKDGSGKMEKLWWMEYFEGSERLSNEPAKYLNKKILVSYQEKEVYNSTLKEYVKVKIIAGIE